MIENGGAFFQEAPGISLIGRLRRRLFPIAAAPRLPNDPRTFITTRIDCHVDWRDRLRLLWSGRLTIQTATYTDVLVNDAESITTFSVAASW